MFPAMRTVLGLTLASLVLLAGDAWLSAVDSSKARADEAQAPKLKDLLTEKLGLLKEIASQKATAYQAGLVPFADVDAANQAVLKTELELCATGKERVAVLEKMLADAKEWEKRVAQQVKSGTAPTSEAVKAKVSRLDVEIALERAKGK